jgi:hypothetical protein
VAHALAQLGKKGTSGMLCGSAPTSVSSLVVSATECNHIRSMKPLGS